MNISKPETKDTVLAIDFGTVRIGLAISRYTLAEPLEIIANDEFARAIDNLLGSPALREKMAVESRRVAKERHWENAFQTFWNENTT